MARHRRVLNGALVKIVLKIILIPKQWNAVTLKLPTPGAIFSNRPFRPVAYLGVGITGLWLGLMLAQLTQSLSPATAQATFHYCEFGLGLLCAVGALLSWSQARARQRGWAHSWRLMVGVGLLLWCFGRLWQGVAPSEPGAAVVNLTSATQIALLCLALAALAAFPAASYGAGKSLADQSAHTPTRRARLVITLDAVAIVLALLGLAWATVLGDAVPSSSSARAVWGYALMCLVFDLILVTLLLLINMLGRPNNPQALAMVSMGLTVLSIADLLNFFSLSTGLAIIPGLSDIGGFLGPVLLAVATITAAVVPDTRIEPQTEPSGIGSMPYWPLGAIVALVIMQQLSRTSIQPIEIFGLIALVCLLVLRQVLTLGENLALVRKVRENQVRLRHEAFHDPLTGLPNRAVFHERLRLAAGLHCQNGQSLAVYFCDVDDLKPVNDGLGHSAGDLLLQVVAQRIADCLRPQDTVARLGGDEFAIIVSDYEQDPEVIGKRILKALNEPTVLVDQRYRPQISIGLVVSDPSEENITAESLTNRADAAMYAAKRAGKGRLVVFRDGVESGPLVLGLTAQLRLAIGRESTDPEAIGLVYQPIMRLTDGAVLAVEALARWTHPTRGPISPKLMIGAAEYGGMLFALDETVLDIACRDLRYVREFTGVNLELHVNLTAASVTDPRLFAAVAQTLDNHNLPASSLVLEITDTERITDLDMAAGICTQINKLGVRWALDDLGAGQGSLQHLLHLPISTVKLDRTLLSSSVDPVKCRAIGSGAVHMTKQLGMSLIANGIERQDQLAWLSMLGCQYGQGYFLSPPLAVRDLIAHHGLARAANFS